MTPRSNGRPGRELARSRMRRWHWPRQIAGGAVRLAARRPSRTLIAMLLVSGTGAFAWNALMQQPMRHPHPLFAKAELPPEPPRRPDAPAIPPLPVPRPETASLSSPRPGADPKPTADARPSAEPRAKSPGQADPIGALIRGGEGAAPQAEAKPSTRIVTAQKALTKLGYGPIEADGLLGTTTRSALERFERDKKLPVTGSLGRKTSRQLAQLSGLQIE